MKKILALIAFAGAGLTLNSCYYDKFNELHPLDGYVNTCDETLENTYTASVNLIIRSNCISCHSSKRADGNVVLETFSQVKTEALNGRLIGVIAHQSGYQAMPPNTKIRDCEITKIQNWIAAGLPE